MARPCEWCGRPTAIVPLCSAACWRMAVWASWFEPARLWNQQGYARRRRNKSFEETEMAGDFPNSGIVFTNDRKRDGSRDADRTGSGDLECPHCRRRFQFFINGWLKVGKSGSKFLSLSFKPKNGAQRAATHAGDDI